jgi:hypothetical protein
VSLLPDLHEAGAMLLLLAVFPAVAEAQDRPLDDSAPNGLLFGGRPGKPSGSRPLACK